MNEEEEEAVRGLSIRAHKVNTQQEDGKGFRSGANGWLPSLKIHPTHFPNLPYFKQASVLK